MSDDLPLWAKVSCSLPFDPAMRACGYRAELIYIRAILITKMRRVITELSPSDFRVISEGVTRQWRQHVELLTNHGFLEATGTGWRIPLDTWGKWNGADDKARARAQKSGVLGLHNRWHRNGKTSPDCPHCTDSDCYSTPIDPFDSGAIAPLIAEKRREEIENISEMFSLLRDPVADGKLKSDEPRTDTPSSRRNIPPRHRVAVARVAAIVADARLTQTKIVPGDRASWLRAAEENFTTESAQRVVELLDQKLTVREIAAEFIGQAWATVTASKLHVPDEHTATLEAEASEQQCDTATATVIDLFPTMPATDDLEYREHAEHEADRTVEDWL